MRPMPPKRRALLAGLLLPATLPCSLAAQTATRRAMSTESAAPRQDQRVAALASGEVVRFGLTLPLRNVAELQALLAAQQDPSSPQFGKYLSRDEFVERYGPTQAQYDQARAFAESQGFQVVRTFGNRLLLNVSGNATQVNKAFSVTMQHYKTAAEGRAYVAPDVEPTVGGAAPLLTVVGLSTRNQPVSMLNRSRVRAIGGTSTGAGEAGATRHAEVNATAFTTGSGPDGEFLGSDMRSAYAPGVTLAGEGQSVGLIELGPYNLSDVYAYFKLVKQSLNVPIYNIYLDVDGVCGPNCDDGEEVIDAEQAISMAPNMSGLLIYTAYGSGSDALTAFSQAASDDVAKQLSLSFGFGGTPSTQPGYEQVFMELAAQGQNVFVASGDSGANVGDVGYPGNSPNITDVGGTDLVTNGPGGAWQSESAWVGSTGGWSTSSPIPAYQTQAINANNKGSKAYRNIPDVAMEANTDNIFCANGGCFEGVGGTSLSAPRWAGFLAMANEQASGFPVGFLNPTVYKLGQTSAYATSFHDIVTGDNFNKSSPNLFQAVPGYDLTTGWGSPNGQSMLDTLAPTATLATEPNFTVTASETTLNLRPGGSASTGVLVTGKNGFSGTVDLSAVLVGAPAGVTAKLSRTSVKSSGQLTLTVDTTAGTPGGNWLVAIQAVSGGVQHTLYVRLALPDFSLTASPTVLYLNQLASATDTLTVDAVNGFDKKVKLSLSDLPPQVKGAIAPKRTDNTTDLTLRAGLLAPTAAAFPLQINGVSGGTSHVLPRLSVAISAATGICGLGENIDLSGAYNLVAVRSDGTKFTDGGLDGGGAALSGNVLARNRVLNGVHFELGAPDKPNAVYANGQTIAVGGGRFEALQLLGLGIDGAQSDQPITVTYRDGSTEQKLLSFSDWYVPNLNVNEQIAVATPYRVLSTGTKSESQFNVYAYTLLLNPNKHVKSFSLPKNRAVILLSATGITDPQLPLGTEVDLSKQFNATGIYADGKTFAGDGGVDGGGAAYSANLLGDVAAAEEIVVSSSAFHLGKAGVPDVVYGAGQTIPLPAGEYTHLEMLGTGVQGDQTDQMLTVHYADGTSEQIVQSFSDWSSQSGYSNEALALRTAYRDYNDGTQDTNPFNVYLYSIKLKQGKQAVSVTLPKNRNVVLLSVTLQQKNYVDVLLRECAVLFGSGSID